MITGIKDLLSQEPSQTSSGLYKLSLPKTKELRSNKYNENSCFQISNKVTDSTNKALKWVFENLSQSNISKLFCGKDKKSLLSLHTKVLEKVFRSIFSSLEALTQELNEVKKSLSQKESDKNVNYLNSSDDTLTHKSNLGSRGNSKVQQNKKSSSDFSKDISFNSSKKQGNIGAKSLENTLVKDRSLSEIEKHRQKKEGLVKSSFKTLKVKGSFTGTELDTLFKVPTYKSSYITKKRNSSAGSFYKKQLAKSSVSISHNLQKLKETGIKSNKLKYCNGSFKEKNKNQYINKTKKPTFNGVISEDDIEEFPAKPFSKKPPRIQKMKPKLEKNPAPKAETSFEIPQTPHKPRITSLNSRKNCISKATKNPANPKVSSDNVFAKDLLENIKTNQKQFETHGSTHTRNHKRRSSTSELESFIKNELEVQKEYNKKGHYPSMIRE